MLEAYFKKPLELYCAGSTLRFDVSQALFSSHQIDTGTRHLLDTLEELPAGSVSSFLDLGCGYGVLGLALKQQHPASVGHLVDRDALAVLYSRHNANLNNFPDLAIYGSLDYHHVQRQDFDLIVSNIPGKAGEEIIASWLLNARPYLAPNGQVAVVIVSPLEELVRSTLDVPDVEITRHESWSSHAVFHYRFTPSPEATPTSAVQQERYRRNVHTVEREDYRFTVETARGLPEFDQLDYQTALLLDALEALEPAELAGELMLYRPGQGHVAVALWQQRQPAHLYLIDRDLLALHYTARNLRRHDCPDDRFTRAHQVGLARPDIAPVSLIAGKLDEDATPAVLEQWLEEAARQLAPQGSLIVVGGSTPITRLLKMAQADKRFSPRKRKRSKGQSMVWLRRRE